MALPAHPQLAACMLAAQAGAVGSSLEVLQCWEQLVGGSGGGATASAAAAVARLLQPAPGPAVLAALAASSGHPAALGIALEQLVARGVVPATELLAALPPDSLAGAVRDLHAAATAPTLDTRTTAAAQHAFTSLIKLLVTSGGSGGSRAQQATDRALQHLRHAWTGGGSDGGDSDSCSSAVLLSAVVSAVDGEVFPRQRATRWLATELGHVLRSGGTCPPAGPQQHKAAAGGSGSDGAALWAASMAAFAVALPADAIYEAVREAAWEGSLAAARGAALLAAMLALRPRTAAAHRARLQGWAWQQAAEALAQHATGALRCLLLLQRELLLAVPPADGGGAGDSGGGGSSGDSGPPPQPWYPLARRGGAGGAPPDAQQRYGAWFIDVLLEPSAQQHLQWLLHQLLIPLIPEGSVDWLEAQADALEVLLGCQRNAHGWGLAPLPAAAERGAGEYVALARQRIRAEREAAAAAAAAQAHGQPAVAAAAAAAQQAPAPGAPLTSLHKGRLLMEGLLQEYQDNEGHLQRSTLAQMQAKAANVFTKAELHNMLVPALTAPTADGAAAAERSALMEYLFDEFGRRGDTVVRAYFRPETVRLYRRLCLQAQLEGASLEQLAARAPQLLLASLEGSAGSGFSGSSGSVSGHQLLDRLGRLVGEQLHLWEREQQRAARQQGQQAQHASHGGSVAAAAGPEQLADVLLRMFGAAYAAWNEQPGAASAAEGPSLLAAAAHVLSIAHGQPLLHAPLLRRLRQQLLVDESGGALGEGAIPEAQRAAAALLAVVAGALQLPADQQPPPAQRRWARGSGEPQPADRDAADLQPLFVWQPQEGAGADTATGGGGSSRGASIKTQPAAVPGPVWLQQVLHDLPLGPLAVAADVAAQCLACCTHFCSYALLPEGGAGEQQTLLLRWRRPAGAPASAEGYQGDFAASLVYPAWPAAPRLSQCLHLRRQAADWLLGSGGGSGGGSLSSRAAKRQRRSEWQGGGGSSTAAADEQAGHALVEAAGKLPLAAFLRLEAAAASSGGGGGDLLPAGAADAAFRLCCTLFLPSGAGDSSAPTPAEEMAAADREAAALRGLVQPLPSTAACGGGGSATASTPRLDEDALVVPDSDEEEAAAAAAAAGVAAGTGLATAVLDGLAVAVAEVLLGSSNSSSSSGSSGGSTGSRQTVAHAPSALVVCQRACAHMLRLLAGEQHGGGAGGTESLLAALLAALVGQCRRQLPMLAAHAGDALQAGQAALWHADEQAATEAGQHLAALARGLLMELLPARFAMLAAQRARLAAMAAAVERGVGEGAVGGRGGASAAAALRQQLEAALRMGA